jgi:hypothetical protein
MTALTASSLVGSLHSLRDKAQGTNLSKAPLISQAHGRNRKSDTHMARHSPFVLLTIQVQMDSIHIIALLLVQYKIFCEPAVI